MAQHSLLSYRDKLDYFEILHGASQPLFRHKFFCPENVTCLLVCDCYLYFRLDLDAWINDPPSDSSDDDGIKMGQSIFVPMNNDDHR